MQKRRIIKLAQHSGKMCKTCASNRSGVYGSVSNLLAKTGTETEKNSRKQLEGLVAGDGFEPPTFGL